MSLEILCGVPETVILIDSQTHRCYLCHLEEIRQEQLELFRREEYAKTETKKYLIQSNEPQRAEEGR
jgi:hypothetical protein